MKTRILLIPLYLAIVTWLSAGTISIDPTRCTTRLHNHIVTRTNITATERGNVIDYLGTKRLSRGKWHCGKVHKVLDSRTTQDWLRKKGNPDPLP